VRGRLPGRNLSRQRNWNPSASKDARGIFIVLIIAVCLAAITTIGQNASSVFSRVANSIQ
jgi:hypothetical protein